jgi:hypothetical protein
MRTIVVAFFICISQIISAQIEEVFSLEDIIVLAQSESPQVKLAEMRKSNAYWTNQQFLADYRPEINLGLVLPSLNRSVNLIDLPDGSSAFRERSQMTNDLSLSLGQNITSTGGQVYASTGIRRLDLFETDNVVGSKSYVSNPLIFGIIQPLFGYNQLKWNKRIMPMVYKEAQATFSEELEAVASQAVRLFFTLLTAQMDLKAAMDRKVVADDLYKLGENRYSVGNIAETDLLQLEMDVMRSDTDISTAKQRAQSANESLRNFLGIYEDVNFNLDLPLEVPEIYIDMEIALAQARNNRSTIISLQRRLLEAEAQVESSKANTGLSGQLSGEVGLTGFGGNISDAYSTLTDQEVITLRLTIPIADWGKAKAAYEIQKSNYELVDLNTGLDRINFENEVKIAVQQFELVKENVELSKRSYELSQKRYDLTRKRYVIGKLDITELNLADIEQESQRQAYIQSINSFWDAYYNIRSLTLYDFINNTPLVKE